MLAAPKGHVIAPAFLLGLAGVQGLGFEGVQAAPADSRPLADCRPSTEGFYGISWLSGRVLPTSVCSSLISNRSCNPSLSLGSYQSHI